MPSSAFLLFLGLSQFALQDGDAMARLKILSVMLPAVLIEKLLIRLDGLRLTRKFIVTDRANKPGSGLRSFQFGKPVHGLERRGIIFIQIKGVGQIAQRVGVLRILRVHLLQNANGRGIIVQLDVHVADPPGQLRILRRRAKSPASACLPLLSIFSAACRFRRAFSAFRPEGARARVGAVKLGKRVIVVG